MTHRIGGNTVGGTGLPTGQRRDLLKVDESMLLDNTAKYTVGRGDTLAAIATAHDTEVRILKVLNPELRERKWIFPGDELVVPIERKSSWNGPSAAPSAAPGSTSSFIRFPPIGPLPPPPPPTKPPLPTTEVGFEAQMNATQTDGITDVAETNQLIFDWTQPMTAEQADMLKTAVANQEAINNFEPAAVGIVDNFVLNAVPTLVIGPTTPGKVKLAWDASPSQGVQGYRVYWGERSKQYTGMTLVDGAQNTATEIANLTPGKTYYFSATAYNAAGDESGYSNEVSKAF